MENELEYALSIFQEPEGYREPDLKPTFIKHQTIQGQELTLRLVGSSPLWGHLLWNAGWVASAYLEAHATSLVRNKNILELGCGAGLPSLVCALNGSKNVVATDYPDAELIENLRFNMTNNAPQVVAAHKISVEGYLWGASIEALVSHIHTPSGENGGFDLLILADLLFNHSEHQKLVKTVRTTLKKSTTAQALVFFTPYRPWLFKKDLAFFDMARGADLTVSKLFEHTMEKVMFDADPGDERLRRTVFAYSLRWSGHVLEDSGQ